MKPLKKLDFIFYIGTVFLNAFWPWLVVIFTKFYLFTIMVSHQCGFFHESSTTWWIECLFTLWAAEWFLTSMDSFMGPHMTWVRAFKGTLWTAKWLLTSVDSFMNFQVTFCDKWFTTLVATEWSFKSGALVSCLSWLIWITNWFPLLFQSTLSLHKLLNCFRFHGESSTDSGASSFVVLLFSKQKHKGKPGSNCTMLI